MEKVIAFIKRYGPPGVLDTAIHGTICQVDNDLEADFYVQVSKSEENPNWMIMGTFPQIINKKEIIEKANEFKNLKF